jgi:hypothetical protein
MSVLHRGYSHSWNLGSWQLIPVVMKQSRVTYPLVDTAASNFVNYVNEAVSYEISEFVA